jgi:lipopolysaccharide/colanic/teichoic acid biosynthesis glycosyltransferase
MRDGQRLLDIVCASVGLALAWPLFLIAAALIKFEDGGPVFFRQERIGRGGKPFQIWKFRSMRSNPAGAALLTVADDPRVTRVGRVLRRTKLDELPQLINVISGEMRLVGPRPEVARYVACYTPEQRRVLALTPGITDPASLAFIDEGTLLAVTADPDRAYIEQIMPEKIRLNLEYAARATIVSDIGLIFHTLRDILSHTVRGWQG